MDAGMHSVLMYQHLNLVGHEMSLYCTLDTMHVYNQ